MDNVSNIVYNLIMGSDKFDCTAVRVVDSHTMGEPTRVVIAGGPVLNGATLQESLQILRSQHDAFRLGVIGEPRGSEVFVGALLCPPSDQKAATGVIFFNDVGYLGMCGHGTIGVVTTLAYLGRITPGDHLIETPVGNVMTRLHEDGRVSVENVPSYRFLADVPVTVPGYGTYEGDIAWGGNWFFLVSDHGFPLTIENRAALMAFTTAMRSALADSDIYGKNNAPIDHIELSAKPHNSENSSRNFMLCPGATFDRSPCGTGTSATMACVYADGELQPGEIWRQEGILGTVFEGTVRPHNGVVVPTITGRAWITGESTLLFDPGDPFRAGIKF
jgi:4-hydroxyproline epimerase